MRVQRTLAAFVYVFVVATLAFAQTPAHGQEPAGGQATSRPRTGPSLGSPGDEAAVRALVEQYQQGFNANDASKAASVYAEDAVFVDVSGRVWEGRAQLEKELAGDSSAAARPRLNLTVQAVRFIKPDVALVRGTSMIEGGNVPPGEGSGHWAVVAMKIGGQWKVEMAEAAANPPAQGRGR